MKDYYVILGVPRDEDQAGIRRAYRRAARRSHPDVAGPDAAARHRDLTTAYEVLTNPQDRAAHDRDLEHAASRQRRRMAPPSAARDPVRAQVVGGRHWMPRHYYVVVAVSRDADVGKVREARRRLVEPYERGAGKAAAPEVEARAQGDPSDVVRPAVVPMTERRGAPRAQPLRERVYDAVDEFMEGWIPGVFTRGRTASRRKDLYVEVILEPEEAARGGLFPLEVPVAEVCDRCAGAGTRGLFYCSPCRGTGTVRGHREVEISMPARVADGTTARLSLEDVGLKGVDLHVLVSVRPTGSG